MPSIDVTQLEVQDRLRRFLLAILPAGTEVVSYQDNQVPEPISDAWVMMTPTQTPRLATNVDTREDVAFTAGISGAKMTVTSVDPDSNSPIAMGAVVFGVGVAPGTTVTSVPTPGPTGDYGLSVAQTVPSGTLMAAGQKAVGGEAEWVVQLDVHGTNLDAGDWAAIISGLFRDAYAVEFFAAIGPEVSPLHADDPRQMAFTQDQQQYEKRWIVEAHLQVNQTIRVPQQYFTTFEVELHSVDAEFPPS